LINLSLIILLLPETHEQLRQVKIKLTQSLHNITQAVTYPGLRVIFPSVFLFWGGFAFFQTFFQVLLIDKLHFSQSNIGDFFAYVGLWIAFTQAVITPAIAKKVAPYNVLRYSLLGAGIALFGNLWAHNTAELLLVTPFFAIFIGQSIANSTALVSLSADKHIQGEVLGINASVQALAQAIPAVLSGYLAEVGINTPVIAGGLTVLAGGALFWLLYRPAKHALHEAGPATAVAP